MTGQYDDVVMLSSASVIYDDTKHGCNYYSVVNKIKIHYRNTTRKVCIERNFKGNFVCNVAIREAIELPIHASRSIVELFYKHLLFCNQPHFLNLVILS